MKIEKRLYDKIVEDYKRKLQSIDDVLLDNEIDEDIRKEKLKQIVDMLGLFNNSKYMLDDQNEPIDLNLPADSGEAFGLPTMKDYLEQLHTDDKKIRDIYFQYWMLASDDKYLEPIISYTNMKIGFVFNCLYLDEESEFITIDNEKHDKSYFFLGPGGRDIISKLKFLVTTFRAVYEKFSVTIKKYIINPRYINPNKEKLKSAPAFFGDDDILAEEFVMSNLLDLLDHFFYIRAILLKKEKIYERNQENASLLLDIRELLDECNYKYKNLVNAFYKTKDYLVDEIDASEVVRVTLSKLYYMIDAIAELRRKEKLTKEDLISALELKREVLYTSVDSNGDANYPFRRIEELLNRFMQEIIILVSENIDAGFENVSNRIKAELGEKYKYIKGSAFKSLATAEYLYEILAATKGVDPNMDYSCISILYYKALEDSLNKLIYKPYYEEYMAPDISIWDGRSRIVLDYIPVDRNRNIEEVDALNDIKRNYYIYNRKIRAFSLAKALTMGSFGHLLNPKNTPKELQIFLSHIINDPCNNCKSLSWDIFAIKDNRNNAAHGGNIIDIEKVKEDKAHIYTLDKATEYKKLLLRLLDVLK